MNGYLNSKASARARFSEIRASISEEERTEKSDKICAHISTMREFSDCDILFAYYPIKTEASALQLIQTALALGKPVALPISVKQDLTLDFRIIRSLEEMKLGAYEIPEPDPLAPRALSSKKSLCIVPALAFDENGSRLGYGKGFYDRFLRDFKGFSIGITFSELLFPSIPTDKNDVAVNAVVTDKLIQKVQ